MKTIRFSVPSVLGITLMAAVIVAVSSTSAHAVGIWDLATDFSLSGSPTAGESDGIGPEGAWSFHVDQGGSEVLFDKTGESKFAGGDQAEPNHLWTSTITGADQNNLWVSKAEVSGSEGPATGFDLLAGEINMAPSTTTNPNSNVVVRWTAPRDMTVNIDGIVWGAHKGQNGRHTSFDITHTGPSGAPHDGGVGNIVPNTGYTGGAFRDAGHPFGGFSDANHPNAGDSNAIQLFVRAGDRIDLKNYAQGGDGTISGLELTISEIPEPTTCTLAALAALGMLGCWRRRNRTT